jgi:hypothetical protein
MWISVMLPRLRRDVWSNNVMLSRLFNLEKKRKMEVDTPCFVCRRR